MLCFEDIWGVWSGNRVRGKEYSPNSFLRRLYCSYTWKYRVAGNSDSSGTLEFPALPLCAGVFAHAKASRVNQSLLLEHVYNGTDFFMSYTFSPHVAAHEISIFLLLLLYMSSRASSLFTQGQKKSWRKVKGSLGPLSWPSTVFSCHFLSSIIVLPRNSSIALGIQLFFLGNAPFREPIFKISMFPTKHFCQNFPIDPDFLSTQVLFLLVRPCRQHLHYFWWWGAVQWSYTMCIFILKVIRSLFRIPSPWATIHFPSFTRTTRAGTHLFWTIPRAAWEIGPFTRQCHRGLRWLAYFVVNTFKF